MNWKFINETNASELDVNRIVAILLENRGIVTEKEKKEFLNPRHPDQITLNELEIDENEVAKAIQRIKLAKENKETILIYGDYDADGVSATCILWEVLHRSGFDVRPYIPDRFEDGYGINAIRVTKLKEECPDLKLIITVDNGIVALQPIKEITEMGIDVIVSDHHQKVEQLPSATAIVHTDKIAGSGVAWILGRELHRSGAADIGPQLDMAAIGTIADVLPLLNLNRSFVKYGLEELNKLQRPGITQLCIQAGVNADNIGVYEVAFVIAPRINSMGRLKNALDSLRLVCTKNLALAQKIASEISLTNSERQRIVDEVVSHAHLQAENSKSNVLIIAHESYHEGVIGLAAAKLVERYYKPAIVISKGEKIAKASARSIDGFNIIEHIRKVEHLIIEGGGHPLAAGFSIEVTKIEEFIKCFNDNCVETLTKEILQRTLPVDLQVNFDLLNWSLVSELKKLEPTGSGNKQPVFASHGVKVSKFKPVGQEGKHLKLVLEQDHKKFDAIGFNLGKYASTLSIGSSIDVAYSLEENTWNGNTSLQLKLKDIHFLNEQ